MNIVLERGILSSDGDEVIATYQNNNDGLEALIMRGNDKFSYRVVFRDSDANETVFVRFSNNYHACIKWVHEFLGVTA